MLDTEIMDHPILTFAFREARALNEPADIGCIAIAAWSALINVSRLMVLAS